MQTFKRVLASATSGHQAESSGPVRYVRKEPAREQRASDTGDGVKSEPQRSSTSIRPSGRISKSHEKENETDSTDGTRWNRPNFSVGGHDVGHPKKTPWSRKFAGRIDSKLGGRLDPPQDGLDSRMGLFRSTTINDEAQPNGLGRGNREISEEDSYTAAKNYAIGVLSKWPQTEMSLRGKLTRKSVPVQVIDQTIKDLQRWGLQSDMEYANIYSRSRWTDHTWGPQRIKEELSRKGVDEETIDAALTELFQISADDVDEDDFSEEMHRWGMTPATAKRLVHQARKQWVRSAPGSDARRNRMITWLQRRRFPWNTIMDIVKTLESEKRT